jgi:hypothetical protein
MKKIIYEINQAKDFGVRLKESNLIEDLSSRLILLGSRNLQEPKNHGELKKILLQDIAAQRSFSLIRLGDGEGNILFWGSRKDEFPELAKLCMERIWRLMFGRNSGSQEDWGSLYDYMVDAIKNANFIGIPTPNQASNSLSRLLLSPEDEFDIRGSTGVISVWDWLSHNHPNHFPVYVNCHVHLSLLKFAFDLVRRAGNLSLITCYPDLLNKLHVRCGVSDGNIFLIPPQAVNIKGTPENIHYPIRFLEICQELSVEGRKGELFFVGAGLAGKVYCEFIRRAGGMAVDVGSLMDIWMGLSVRPYQSSCFIETHKL